nr:tumor necrosis factor alpha-induced protein 2-like isoform X2 [Scatophagus argus]XP_046269278.1 tumor necrosis factor alpha-induced protein 2-like isoform X2 [Scatophagus argus]
MRLRSHSAETEGLSGRPAGGRRFNVRLPKIFGGQRRPSGQHADNTSTTDGHQSPHEEEPRKVNLTFEQMLEEQLFCEASQLLIKREERLFGEITEADALKRREEEADKLAADYRQLADLIVQALKLSLSPGEVSVEALTSAVKAINQEVVQDKQWKQRDRTQPAWRPSEWKKLHDDTLRSLVEQHMDNPSTPSAIEMEQSTILKDIHAMGRQLKEDLLLVVRTVKNCYPPEMNICNFYASLYHQNLSARLRKIAEFVLEDKDCTFLLRWVNEFYPEILQKPELAADIDGEALEKLLPKELLEPLEDQYLSKQEEELTTYIGRVLDEAKEKWSKGEEPTREDDCYASPLAYDIIQVVSGMVKSAERVVGDQHKAQSITCQLKDLMQSFKNFQNDIMKQSKANSGAFIKANLGCIKQFSDVLQQQSHLFPEDVRKTCLLILPDMKQSAHRYLLKPVHEALKPHYRKLGTNDWLNKPVFENLLAGIDQEVQDLQGSPDSCHQELIGQLHQEVTTEYVKRLLKGEIKLKDKKQQQEAYELMKDNAEHLCKLFDHLSSKEDWLKDVLTKIAEVLKLQDLPAIQMHIASLGTAFPDLSEKHVSALLKLKTNLSRADRKAVKATLSDTLRETSCVSARTFFSDVQVK